jgi:hypothetical protein
LFGQVSSTWRLEQLVEFADGELLRLERKRSAALGLVVPWETWRQKTFLNVSLEVEDRYREDVGDSGSVAVDPIQQDPALIGGQLGLSFGNVSAGVRSISVQDGIRMSASIDYLKAHSGDRWRSGWEVASSAYRSFPSWTTAGRPILAVTARVAEERGPAASRLTAGGIGTLPVLATGGTNFEVRGYPPGLLAAGALWSARTEMRLPIARVSRGLGALPLYLRGFSGIGVHRQCRSCESGRSIGSAAASLHRRRAVERCRVVLVSRASPPHRRRRAAEELRCRQPR